MSSTNGKQDLYEDGQLNDRKKVKRTMKKSVPMMNVQYGGATSYAPIYAAGQVPFYYNNGNVKVWTDMFAWVS